MAKYLVVGSYSAEGLKGLQKDKASGRQKAVEGALSALGGKLEGIYYAFGEDDVYVLCDFPDNVSVAAMSLGVSSTGLVRIKTIPLLTVAEVDQALSKTVSYRAPGAAHAG